MFHRIIIKLWQRLTANLSSGEEGKFFSLSRCFCFANVFLFAQRRSSSGLNTCLFAVFFSQIRTRLCVCVCVCVFFLVSSLQLQRQMLFCSLCNNSSAGAFDFFFLYMRTRFNVSFCFTNWALTRQLAFRIVVIEEIQAALWANGHSPEFPRPAADSSRWDNSIADAIIRFRTGDIGQLPYRNAACWIIRPPAHDYAREMITCRAWEADISIRAAFFSYFIFAQHFIDLTCVCVPIIVL